MTATDAAPQESDDTASGAGVSIIMSSMKIRLAFQHSLINMRFFLSLFYQKVPLIGGGWSMQFFNR